MLGDSPEERSASPSTSFDRLSNRPGTEGREKKMERKWLYEVLYNNLLLPRRREIDREEEREAFNGTTESLVKLYREN